MYKGGEGTKKIYNESIKNDADNFTRLMGTALINNEYKKVGLWYYFETGTKLLVFAVFDGY